MCGQQCCWHKLSQKLQKDANLNFFKVPLLYDIPRQIVLYTDPIFLTSSVVYCWSVCPKTRWLRVFSQKTIKMEPTASWFGSKYLGLDIRGYVTQESEYSRFRNLALCLQPPADAKGFLAKMTPCWSFHIFERAEWSWTETTKTSSAGISSSFWHHKELNVFSASFLCVILKFLT